MKSATTISVTAPAGTGTVDVRVTTTAGRSAKVSSDRYSYRAPATQYIVTASSYSPVAGTTVTVSAQLADASDNPVHTSGVTVTWSKTGSGGSFSSATSATNASGIATVTLTTGTSAGATYTVTATDGSARTGTSQTITTTAGLAAKMALTPATTSRPPSARRWASHRASSSPTPTATPSPG